jgi:glycosyltransferase involved in cell wall biosynthesis
VEGRRPDAPLVSVVICTHNRARQLRQALQSVAAQTLPRDGFETIVVDNASTDDTRTLAHEFRAAANVHYLFESTRGLCHARNAGWRAARGPYVAYLDDDAEATPGWLVEILRAFESVRPTPGCVGGRVDPVYEAPRPAWLSDDIALSLTIVDWSETPHVIQDLRREWLVGANLACRRAALEDVGGFHPALDRSGNNLLSSGDVYLQRLIMEAGHSCYYHPAAAVRHHVPASRLERRWFVRRYYWQGVSDAMMEILHDRPTASARRRAALRRALALFGSPTQLAALALPTADPDRFTSKCWALIALGHVMGLLRARP